MSLTPDFLAAALITGDRAEIDKLLNQVNFASELEPRQAIRLIDVHAPREWKLRLQSLVLKRIECVPPLEDYRPTVETVYRACTIPPDIVRQSGFRSLGQSVSIYEHKIATGCSIYVSTTKSLRIAFEHAGGDTEKYIYKLSSSGGIDCAKWFAPLREIHEEEKEVAFPYQVPPAQVNEFLVCRNPLTYERLHA